MKSFAMAVSIGMIALGGACGMFIGGTGARIALAKTVAMNTTSPVAERFAHSVAATPQPAAPQSAAPQSAAPAAESTASRSGGQQSTAPAPLQHALTELPTPSRFVSPRTDGPAHPQVATREQPRH
jgi:hypothetical protein